MAEDWDAVHLTLGGFLTAEQVRLDGPEGWTEHRFWEFEQTVWLRWVFSMVEDLGELAEYPPQPLSFAQPEAFRFDDERPWRKEILLVKEGHLRGS